MAIRNWFGALVVGGLIGVVGAGCSSSTGTTPGDGGGEGDALVRKMLDSGLGSLGDDAGDSGIAGGFDGTTGKPCTSDVDCVSDAGPGINTCSSDYQFTITNVPVALWATPVCILPPPMSSAQGNCDPVPGGVQDGLPHFCDGPDVPTSPGLCLPFDQNNPQPGQGVCYPLCTFALDGTKATGCIGTDTCFPVTFLRDTMSGAVTGYGFCAGGCQKDADCTGLGAGFVCQTDIGYCTTKKLARTKAVGTACSTTNAAGVTVGATDDATTGACNCDSDPTTGLGFCSTACTVGGTPCQGGWTCDAGYPNPLVFMSSAGGAAINVPLTAQNVGAPGTCRPICMLADAGAVDAGVAPAVDAGDSDAAVVPVATDAGSAPTAACPTNTTCQDMNLAGPDCVP